MRHVLVETQEMADLILRLYSGAGSGADGSHDIFIDNDGESAVM